MNGHLITLKIRQTMTQNNNNSLKTNDMKKLYEILFENKKPEEQPLKLEIKLMSTATPDEQLDENEWYKLIYDLNNKRLG
jgi:polyisoprenoid-binding protein YceI